VDTKVLTSSGDEIANIWRRERDALTSNDAARAAAAAAASTPSQQTIASITTPSITTGSSTPLASLMRPTPAVARFS
jgi:hypothetical protein